MTMKQWNSNRFSLLLKRNLSLRTKNSWKYYEPLLLKTHTCMMSSWQESFLNFSLMNLYSTTETKSENANQTSVETFSRMHMNNFPTIVIDIWLWILTSRRSWCFTMPVFLMKSREIEPNGLPKRRPLSKQKTIDNFLIIFSMK